MITLAKTVPRQPTLLQRLQQFSLFYKVFVPNALIVLLGAVVGTWLTSETVRRAPNESYVLLAMLLGMAGLLLSLTINYIVLKAAFRPLDVLNRAATDVRLGDYSVRIPPLPADPQISGLAATINATLDAIELDRQELRALSNQVIRAQEEERKRIARELHDDTSQVLFAQVLQLTQLKQAASPDLHHAIETAERALVDALESVRRIALELRPPALDDLGLQLAVADLVQRFSESSGIACDLQVRGSRGRLGAEIELVLYRVIQEALTNIGKHARAKHAWIDIERGPKDVTASIRDDGIGFTESMQKSRTIPTVSLGIFGMEERVALVQGTLKIWHHPGGGTEVFVFIPLEPTEDTGTTEGQ